MTQTVPQSDGMPECVGEMSSLRWLRADSTGLIDLPESISALSKLVKKMLPSKLVYCFISVLLTVLYLNSYQSKFISGIGVIYTIVSVSKYRESGLKVLSINNLVVSVHNILQFVEHCFSSGSIISLIYFSIPCARSGTICC